MSNPGPTLRRGVLAGGGWLVDHVKMIDSWPVQDSLVTVSTWSRANGGCPYNVLKALAKLECGFALTGMGLIGDDPDGDWILEDCRLCGIDGQFLRKTAKASTSFTDVMTVAATGRRTFFYYPGANAFLAENDFHLAGSRARIFHLGYLALLEGLDALDHAGRTGASRLLESAGQLGMLTAADLVSNSAGDFPVLINPCLPWLDYLFLNEFEAAKLLGTAPSEIEGGVSAAWLADSARQILRRGVRRAVIIHTPPGAVWVNREDGPRSQGSVRMPPEAIRGAAGAGDAFCAGCLLGIHQGWNTADCLELAVCVAATSLGNATCSGAIRPWRECLRDGRLQGFAEFEIA